MPTKETGMVRVEQWEGKLFSDPTGKQLPGWSRWHGIKKEGFQPHDLGGCPLC